MNVKKITAGLAASLVGVGLAIPTFQPELANIGIFILSGLSLAILLRMRAWRKLLTRPAVLFPLLAGLMLTCAFCVTAKSPLGPVSAIYFAPLYLVAPMAALLMSVDTKTLLMRIGVAATIGSMAAFCVAAYDRLVLGLDRGGTSVANPIHFADVVLTIGFIGLLGVRAEKRWVRIASICGLFAALGAVLLSGSRGAVVAAFPMGLSALAIFASKINNRSRIVLGVSVVFFVVALTLSIQHLEIFGRITLIGDLRKLLQYGVTTDASTAERLVLYRAAFDAFMASPIFGHGLIDLGATVAQFATSENGLQSFPHLHNDIADFGVSGGGVGLLAYCLIILAPFAEAISSPSRSNRFSALYLATILTVGYFTMGLTNAMFGVLSVTSLFGFALAALVSLSAERDKFQHTAIKGRVESPAPGHSFVVGTRSAR